MKKRLALFIAVLFVALLVACNNKEETPTDQDAKADVDEVLEDDVTLENDEDDTDEADDQEVKQAESGEENKCADETLTSGSNGSEKDEDCEDEGTNGSEAKKESWKKPDKIDNMNHLKIVYLAYDIFEAQDKKNYSFLESVAAEGTKVDRNNNKFSFENVTYPFEMDFFTKEDLGELEFRYTHEEDGIVYVGFGAINYEEESSFVVDFQFVEEGGKWKMRSMDINK